MEIQKIDVKKRPDTGPMQFHGDWPGVFIRGDEALHFAAMIEWLFAGKVIVLDNSVLRRLATILQSCCVDKNDEAA